MDRNTTVIELKKVAIAYFVFWLFYIKPGIFYFIQSLNWAGDVYNICQLFGAGMVILLAIIYAAGSTDELIWCMVVYLGYLIVVSLIKSGSMLELFMYTIRVIGVILAINIAYNTGALRDCFVAFIYALGINVFINCMTIFLYASEGGMYSGVIKNGYYLGYDNVHIIYTLPFLACSLFYDLYFCRNCRKITIFMHILIVASVLITHSGTTIIAVMVFYALSLLVKNEKARVLFNEWIIIGANIFIFIFFILKKKYLLFRRFFYGIAGKNLKDVRQWIWNKYERVIFRDPLILGHGYMSDSKRLQNVGSIHAHNMYLDILFEGGILELVIFLTIFLVCIRKSRIANKPINRILISCIVAFMIAYQVEVYNKIFVFAIVSFCYYFSGLEYSSGKGDEGI